MRAYFAWKEIAEQRPWRDAMLRVGEELARTESYDAIVTCGPPHLVHTAGARLSARTGIPLVVDFRDPWSLQRVLPEHRASQLWFDMVSRYESEGVRQASLVVMNTEPCRDAMRARYAHHADKIIAVTNGYDEQESLPSPATDGRFRLIYSGTLYFVYEHPGAFFEGVSRLVREFGLTPAELAIEFIGDAAGFNGVPTSSLARAAGVEQFFQDLPFVPRKEVFQHLSRASVLVSLSQLNDLAIPSKLFDYMRFNAWILAIAGTGSATEVVLRGTNADVVPLNDADLIHRTLRERFLQFRRGERPVAIAAATRSSRREQAGVLFDALDPIVRRARGSGEAEK
jgi:glycosyltransferase involved in cell wall biosynthesis